MRLPFRQFSGSSRQEQYVEARIKDQLQDFASCAQWQSQFCISLNRLLSMKHDFLLKQVLCVVIFSVDSNPFDDSLPLTSAMQMVNIFSTATSSTNSPSIPPSSSASQSAFPSCSVAFVILRWDSTMDNCRRGRHSDYDMENQQKVTRKWAHLTDYVHTFEESICIIIISKHQTISY